ncbi:MAG: 2-dehydropantoate 2-reductase [Pseudomonadota bacterium]
MEHSPKIAVLGAGAIGCIVGGFLAELKYQPLLIGRSHILEPLKTHGLSFDAGMPYMIRPSLFDIAETSEALSDADVIFVTTKATSLNQVVEDIRNFAKTDSLVICLLNGIAPVRFLQASLPERIVLAGMVPYNVIWLSDHHLQQSSFGQIALQSHPATEKLALWRPDWFEVSTDMDAIQNGKLLLNLINPVNALSGMPIVEMLGDRGYRLLYADAVAEALNVYKAGDLRYKNLAALPMPMMLSILRGPDWLVKRLVISRQKLSPRTMSSMAHDYAAQRPTEIDFINGEIVALGQSLGVPTPINSALVHWIQSGKERGWPNPSPEEIRSRF